jgi:type VI secretion system protein ImpA
MTVPIEFSALGTPISVDGPCGTDLEDGPVLGRFNGYRVFGRDTAWEQMEQQPDWAQIRAESLGALATSKDLRVLAHLAAASLRTDGIGLFCGTLAVAADWLEQFWDSLHPGLDEDGVFRRNALSCFSDRVAIIDALRRAPLVISRAHGTFNLRDIDLAQAQLAATPDTPTPQDAAISAAFAEIAFNELNAIQAAIAGALQAIRRIEVKTTETGGLERAPDLESLRKNLSRIDKFLQSKQAAHPTAQTASAGAAVRPDDQAASGTSGGSLGAVRSRQDAVRVLDAVAKFFSENEPSSPIPMFVERAKRLVAKNFLEVLEDVAPDAVTQARKAGGMRE